MVCCDVRVVSTLLIRLRHKVLPHFSVSKTAIVSHWGKIVLFKGLVGVLQGQFSQPFGHRNRIIRQHFR